MKYKFVSRGTSCFARRYYVHHLNGIKDDNRIENLELLGRGKHYLITKMQEKISELEKENKKLKKKL